MLSKSTIVLFGKLPSFLARKEVDNNRSIKNIGVYILLLLFASVGMFALMDRLLIVTKLDLNDGVADASIKSSYTI